MPKPPKPAQKFIKSAIKKGLLWGCPKSGQVFTRRGPVTARDTKGYVVGNIRWRGEKKQFKAHQVVWFHSGRSVPKGYMLDHINRVKDDNRLCNLRIVTPRQNSANYDVRRGERHSGTRLKNSDIIDIRNKYKIVKNYTHIAREYNLTPPAIRYIVVGKTWGHIKS